jgi:putative transposase
MQGFLKPSPNRKRLRLPNYDYSQAGAYFVTVVTYGRACLFGYVVEGEMRLNEAGEMVDTVCREIPHSMPNMGWGIYQIMPNHFHAIIELNCIVGATLRGCPGQTQRSAPTDGPQTNAPTDGLNHTRLTLGDVVGRFKSLTTRHYIDGVRTSHWHPFTNRLWQRNYYEHIICDEIDYQSIVDYIISNPHNWESDQEYLAQ